ALADDARQTVDRARAAEQAAAHVVVADLRVLLRNREIAVDHDLEAAGGDVAFEHGDGGLRRAKDGVADPGRAEGDLVRRALADEVALELVEVEAGAEGALPAADDQHADVVVLLGPDARLVQLLEELLADRVLLVRTVEPDSGDVPVDLVLDGLGLDYTRHSASPFAD